MATAGLIGLVKSYSFAFVLGSENFGFYNLTLVICNYLIIFFSFGLIEGLTIKLPWFYGEGKTEDIHAYMGNTFIRYFLTGTVATFAITLLGYSIGGFISIPSIVLLLGGLQAIHSGLLTLLVTDALSAGNIVSFGKVSVLRSGSTLVFGLAGAWLYGYEGAVVGELVAIFILIFLILYRKKYIFHADSLYHPDIKLGFLYREGFPVLRHNLLILIQQSIDKWFILFALGIGSLGQYSFAMIIMAGFLLVHVSVGRHVGPRIIRETAQGIPLRNSLKWLFKVIGLILALSVPLGLFIVFVSEYLLKSYITGYAEGVSIIPVVTIASIIQVTYLFDWFLFAGKKSRELSYITLFMTIVYIICGLYGINNEFNLMDYAILMLIMRAGLWLLTVTLAVRISWGKAAPGQMI